MSDRDIDYSDIPRIAPARFARAVLRRGLRPVPAKELVTFRIDADVLKWFRSLGPGYQTQVNALLREYMAAHRSRNKRS